MRHVPLYLVDAFTAEPFQGNPAAICLLDHVESSHWMQQVAMEMNQSETAFVLREGTAFRIRWFTPTSEVELCGHATLATAHTLWQSNHVLADESIRFESDGGTLFAEQVKDWIKLDFPKDAPTPCPIPDLLPSSLGEAPLSTLTTRHDILALFETEQQLIDLKPDMERIASLPFRGIIATAKSQTADIDFVSRFFAPSVGIPEDPVTGSAHCALAPYWSYQLGKDDLVARQLSQRGGELRVHVESEARTGRYGDGRETID